MICTYEEPKGYGMDGYHPCGSYPNCEGCPWAKEDEDAEKVD